MAMVYRLYVDEVGGDDLGHCHLEPHRYLSLTGVAIHHDHARDFATPQLAKLKADIFKHDPDDPVILHRTDIMNKKGPFGVLTDDGLRQEFDDRLCAFINDVQYTVITAVIDKFMMKQQAHWQNKHPYHYLMEILVEKYTQWLERRGSKGDIMPEMRQGVKDVALQEAYLDVWNLGTYFVNRTRIQARLPAKQLKFRDKKANVTGLQLCDSLAHPSYIHVRDRQGHNVQLGPFAARVVPILLKNKYDRSPWQGVITGYGIKYLP